MRFTGRLKYCHLWKSAQFYGKDGGFHLPCLLLFIIAKSPWIQIKEKNNLKVVSDCIWTFNSVLKVRSTPVKEMWTRWTYSGFFFVFSQCYHTFKFVTFHLNTFQNQAYFHFVLFVKRKIWKWTKCVDNHFSERNTKSLKEGKSIHADNYHYL